MRSKKGFTLIELLAVILILGIIALIAIPVVTNIIEEAKKGAAQRSADGFINAVENQLAVANISDSIDDIGDGSYRAGTLFTTYNVSIKGTKPTNDSWVYINNGLVEDYSLVESGYVITKGKEIVKGNIPIKNPNSVCNIISGNSYEVGSEYECDPGDGTTRTFYVLEVVGNNVSLIMDRNIDSELIQWSADGKNANGPVTAITKLPANWNSVTVSLPTAQQIANAAAKTTWTAGGEHVTDIPTWMYINLVDGYWTSTATTNVDYRAWYVGVNALATGLASETRYMGVRPVITVLKSKM